MNVLHQRLRISSRLPEVYRDRQPPVGGDRTRPSLVKLAQPEGEQLVCAELRFVWKESGLAKMW